MNDKIFSTTTTTTKYRKEFRFFFRFDKQTSDRFVFDQQYVFRNSDNQFQIGQQSSSSTTKKAIPEKKQQQYLSDYG
ncbi:hypothetical protein DERP_011006 [Dermatophagoides pteronyssinus]|uniref:Uncharacterized protein n=1 Tax=Dermatophagoides pteronyssinus TaxID=6956 RepID=A0ABQ8JV39_DERPT|nr:hypothetical protein DERP_011006 [Dermatophagoides pteronyssinus]